MYFVPSPECATFHIRGGRSWAGRLKINYLCVYCEHRYQFVLEYNDTLISVNTTMLPKTWSVNFSRVSVFTPLGILRRQVKHGRETQLPILVSELYLTGPTRLGHSHNQQCLGVGRIDVGHQFGACPKILSKSSPRCSCRLAATLAVACLPWLQASHRPTSAKRSPHRLASHAIWSMRPHRIVVRASHDYFFKFRVCGVAWIPSCLTRDSRDVSKAE